VAWPPAVSHAPCRRPLPSPTPAAGLRMPSIRPHKPRPWLQIHRWIIKTFGVEHHPYTKSRHLEKYKKSPYLGCSSSNFYEIRPDDTLRPSWPFWPLKIWKFQKSFTRRVRIAGGRFWCAARNSVNRTCSMSTLCLLSWCCGPNISVCTSVSLCIISHYCTNMTKSRITETTLNVDLATVVFWGQKYLQNCNGVAPAGVPITGGEG